MPVSGAVGTREVFLIAVVTAGALLTIRFLFPLFTASTTPILVNPPTSYASLASLLNEEIKVSIEQNPMGFYLVNS